MSVSVNIELKRVHQELCGSADVTVVLMGEMLVIPVMYLCRCTSTSAMMQQFCLLVGRQVVHGVSSLFILLIVKGKVDHAAVWSIGGVLISLSVAVEPIQTTKVCDAWPVRRQTYGYALIVL